MGGCSSTAATAPTILQVVPELNAGGVERGSIEIAAAIVAAGGRALVASAGGRLEPALEAVGGAHVRLPLRAKAPWTLRANAGALADLIVSEGVDLIHARSRAPGWSAKWAAARTGAPFVTTYHGTYSEAFPLKRRYNSVMASGDRVVAISEFIAELIQERHATPVERIRVIPRGADLTAFDPAAVAPERVDALRSRWATPADGPPVVMLPGRLTRWKGQTVFIEAMARLAEARGEGAARALIVGGADAKAAAYEAELTAMIAARRLGARVRLVGHCDDMPAALALADVVVSASTDPEAFGRVSVEAQAMARPIVASAHGGSVETVADGVTGYLATPDDPDALARAIGAALALSDAERRSMGAAGRARVVERFSTTRMQAATLAVYNELLSRP